ncbi:acyltransferase [Enterobacter bugandensis]|uniref:acyltransferase n=1 Tax=Enterobacter bugandensis TaxID=881260 RepID=UPI001E3C5676|nr:acyltransferase [Enterobacter bugandensis]MCE1393539.1 acyltransferase [Enterobacter bugandensis]MCK7065793.1 acyltransferase [Enterobacter bugandensis]
MIAKRIQGVEVLRVFAIFMVVLIHSTPEYTNSSGSNLAALILQSISRAGFISFFLISGYFALNEKIVSLKKYYYNRFVTIVIPFLLYAYIHYFMVHYDFGRAVNSLSGFFSINTLTNFLHAIIIGPAFNGSMFVSLHFWFIYWIVGAYAVAPFVGYVIQRIEPASRLKSIAFLLGVSWLHLYINRYFPNANIISIPFITDGWFVYFLIGGLLYGLDLNKYRKYALLFCVIGYVLTIFLTWYNFAILSIYQAPYGIDINMVLCACGFFIIFQTLRENPLATWFARASKYTYGIYLTHVFMMYFVSGFTKTATSSEIANSVFTAVVAFTLALIFCFFFDNLFIFKLIKKLKLRNA